MTLHTERLRQINGEVDYDADAISSRDFPLRGLTTHISIQNGVMRLKPLAFAFTAGKLSGALSIDARKSVPVTAVDARITDIHIEHFIKGGGEAAFGPGRGAGATHRHRGLGAQGRCQRRRRLHRRFCRRAR